MSNPSKKSLAVAEALFDHVSHGMTRGDVIAEWAEIIDEGNAELLEAARALLWSAEGTGGLPAGMYLARLREVAARYRPAKLRRPPAEAPLPQPDRTPRP